MTPRSGVAGGVAREVELVRASAAEIVRRGRQDLVGHATPSGVHLKNIILLYGVVLR